MNERFTLADVSKNKSYLPSTISTSSNIYNIYAFDNIYINQGDAIIINTALKVNLADDEILMITNHTDTSIDNNMMIINAPLLIDNSYFNNHNQITLMLKNIGQLLSNTQINVGEPIAQAIVIKSANSQMTDDKLMDTKKPANTDNTPVMSVDTDSVGNKRKHGIAYCDGSFNANTNVYGYGVLIQVDGQSYRFSGSARDREKASMRNVAGEIDGAVRTIDEAINLGITDLTIYYDYEGVRKWCTREWKAKNQYTQAYRDYFARKNKKININFVHVYGHSGVDGNEEVDFIAKKAVGLY